MYGNLKASGPLPKNINYTGMIVISRWILLPFENPDEEGAVFHKWEDGPVARRTIDRPPLPSEEA